MKKATLILEDGSCFEGESFGYEKPVVGEVVFNTAMMGYPESLTDPSYAGQLMVLTYPLVGNYGVPPFSMEKNGIPVYMESGRIHAEALIVSDYSETFSHIPVNVPAKKQLSYALCHPHKYAYVQKVPSSWNNCLAMEYQKHIRTHDKYRKHLPLNQSKRQQKTVHSIYGLHLHSYDIVSFCVFPSSLPHPFSSHNETYKDVLILPLQTNDLLQ